MQPITDRLTRISGLDGAAARLRQLSDRSGLSCVARKGERWLGHSMHPPLTDLPIGFWTSAWLLDLVGGARSAPAARKLVGFGVLTALPTAAAGLGDLHYLDREHQRIGVVHAAANTVALVLFAMSWRKRGKGQRARGIALTWLGAIAATAGGALGGALAFPKPPNGNDEVELDLPA